MHLWLMWRSQKAKNTLQTGDSIYYAIHKWTIFSIIINQHLLMHSKWQPPIVIQWLRYNFQQVYTEIVPLDRWKNRNKRNGVSSRVTNRTFSEFTDAIDAEDTGGVSTHRLLLIICKFYGAFNDTGILCFIGKSYKTRQSTQNDIMLKTVKS